MAGKNTTSSLGTVNERRLRPVYDLLDNGNNKSAVHEADKVLKKQRDLSAAKVLKTIALHRLGQIAEAFSLSQEVAVTGPTDENSLQGLTLYYRETQRTDLIPPMYEIALAKCPGNEDYMTHLFMSYVRVGKPKEMQRVALNLFKQHPKNPYLFWGVMSIVMQANDNEKLGKVMFLPLAEKMIEKHIAKGRLEAEAETRLYLMVLDALGKYEKAMEVLEVEATRYFLMNKDSIQEMISDLNKKLGRWDEVNRVAKKQCQQNPDVWNYTLDYLDSLLHLINDDWKPQEGEGSSSEVDFTWDAAINFFRDIENIEIQVNYDRPRRGPHLALLEVATRVRNYHKGSKVDEELGDMVDLIVDYANVFSTKPCCFNDLKRYIQAVTADEKAKVLEKINTVISSKFSRKDEKSLTNGDVDDKTKEKEIQSHLTYLKLQRYLGHHEILSREDKLELVADLLERHEGGLKYSEYRPSTDLRAVDDYCLVAANIFHDLYTKEGDVEFAWRALYVLELAKQKSDVNHKFKFMLIRLYCDFGIFMPCANIYDSLDIKHVQQDTLGYLICNSVSSLGHYQLASQAFEASRAYFLSNDRDSLEFLISCFKNGAFHKVPEFVSFRKRVKSSIQAAHTLLEHAYMDLVTQADIESPLPDLLESSCLPDEMTKFDELTDNRDFSLTFDWTTDERSTSEKHILTSFSLEKKWLQFREMEIRSIIRLLTKEIDGDSFLQKLEDSIQSLNDPDLQIEMPLHGPPRPRTTAALESNYPSIVLQLLQLFEKIMNESSNLDGSSENVSKSVISGIKELIASLSVLDDTKKAMNHENHHRDDDVTTSVISQEAVKKALTLPVPDTLKGLNRNKLQRLVYVSELFSLSVLLTYNFQSFVADIKSDAIKKRRRKKGKQEPLPSIIQFYQGLVKELEEIGLNLKIIISNMQLDAQIMTLDLSKATIEDKLPNGVTMQEGTSEETSKPEPTVVDVPSQLIKMASGSLTNATKQLSLVVEGRLKNLKNIKI